MRVAQTTASTGRAKPSTTTRSSRLRTTCSRMARPVDWSSTTITVLRAEGSTLTCAFAMDSPLGVDYCALWEKPTPAPPALSSKQGRFRAISLRGCCGAGRETRTLMVLPPADFESAASTGSAIPARIEAKSIIRRRCWSPSSTTTLPRRAHRPAPRAAAQREPPAAPGCGQRRAQDLKFADLPQLRRRRSDALVLNDTRVIKARLAGQQGERRQDRAVRRARARRARGAGADHARATRRRRAPSSSSARFAVDDRGARGRALPRALRRGHRQACSSASARCRCRPTSATRRRPRTPSATRPSTRARPARSRRRPPGCISTRRC